MASLNDVCFERIRDTFYYGMFGEFKLVVDKKTGCFNATKLCNDGGKEFKGWTRLMKSQKLMEYYQTSRGVKSPLGSDSGCFNRIKCQKPGICSDFYEVKGNNKDELAAKTTGQYVRKELILDIASWVSVEFYDKCNQIIVDFYVADFKRKEAEKLKEKDDIFEKFRHESEARHSELMRNHAELMTRYDKLLRHAENTNNQLTHLTETVEDHNEQLPEKLVDVLRPIASNL